MSATSKGDAAWSWMNGGALEGHWYVRPGHKKKKKKEMRVGVDYVVTYEAAVEAELASLGPQQAKTLRGRHWELDEYIEYTEYLSINASANNSSAHAKSFDGFLSTAGNTIVCSQRPHLLPAGQTSPLWRDVMCTRTTHGVVVDNNGAIKVYDDNGDEPFKVRVSLGYFKLKTVVVLQADNNTTSTAPENTHHSRTQSSTDNCAITVATTGGHQGKGHTRCCISRPVPAGAGSSASSAPCMTPAAAAVSTTTAAPVLVVDYGAEEEERRAAAEQAAARVAAAAAAATLARKNAEAEKQQQACARFTPKMKVIITSLASAAISTNLPTETPAEGFVADNYNNLAGNSLVTVGYYRNGKDLTFNHFHPQHLSPLALTVVASGASDWDAMVEGNTYKSYGLCEIKAESYAFFCRMPLPLDAAKPTFFSAAAKCMDDKSVRMIKLGDVCGANRVIAIEKGTVGDLRVLVVPLQSEDLLDMKWWCSGVWDEDYTPGSGEVSAGAVRVACAFMEQEKATRVGISSRSASVGAAAVVASAANKHRETAELLSEQACMVHMAEMKRLRDAEREEEGKRRAAEEEEKSRQKREKDAKRKREARAKERKSKPPKVPRSSRSQTEMQVEGSYDHPPAFEERMSSAMEMMAKSVATLASTVSTQLSAQDARLDQNKKDNEDLIKSGLHAIQSQLVAPQPQIDPMQHTRQIIELMMMMQGIPRQTTAMPSSTYLLNSSSATSTAAPLPFQQPPLPFQPLPSQSHFTGFNTELPLHGPTSTGP